MATLTSSSHMNIKISSGRIALLITLGTESAFFVTALVSYFALRDQAHWDVPHTLARLTIPLVNSAVLFASALLAWRASSAIREGRPRALQSLLTFTLALGLLFVVGQIYEFNHAGLRLEDPSFGGVFFTLITFHAVHVLAGMVFLALILMRAALGDFSAERHEPVKLAALFWYYVTAVWALLFIALYLV